MVNKERILKSIFMAVDEVNNVLSKDNKMDKSLETILVGKNGKLDSLGFVSFITSVEQKIEEGFGTIVTLANEKAMSQKDSPFENIGRLVDYISLLLEEESK